MHVVTMPQLGLTMTEGKVGRWLKAVGDTVSKGEPLVEISTDKLNNEMEAPADGVLVKIIAQEGDVIPVKQAIAVLAGQGEAVDEATLAAVTGDAVSEEQQPLVPAQPAKPIEPPTPVLTREAGARIKISPLARKWAKQYNIDYTRLVGSGPQGRIIKKDVVAAQEAGRLRISPLARKMAVAYDLDVSTIKGSGPSGRIVKQDIVQAMPQPTKPELAADVRVVPPQPVDRVVPLSGMRKVIAQRMCESAFSAPQFTLNTSVDMTAARAFRTSVMATIEKKYGVKLSYTDLIVKACAAALEDHPGVNTTFGGDSIIYHKAVHIGVAVALDEGLIVPVLRDVGQKTVGTVAKETKELSARARSNKLTMDEMTGGTFTVSNLGMFGIDTFTPIINQPESAILGVGRIVDTPVAKNGEVTIAPVMQLSLTVDHRSIDGAVGAKFLQTLKEYLENPALLAC